MKYNRLKNYLRDLRNREAPDLYIFSYGGCGTRTFFEFVRARRKLNSQPHVHYGRIEDVPAGVRALYLYGDPRDAVLSFLGRQENDDATFVTRHLENLDASCKKMPSLEAYVDEGHDVFQLKRHFERYVYNDQRRCELMVVRFEDIWDHLDEVLGYVGLADAVSDFPPQRARRSKQQSLEPITRVTLNTYMKPLLEMQNSLPPIWHLQAK